MTFSNNCGTRFELELKLEIQKLVIFLRENAYFHKTLCSRVRCYKVWLKAQNVKKRCEFTIGKRQPKKMVKNVIWDRLGLHLGGFGRGLGRDLEPLGASWVVFGALFSMLVFGMVVKSALGGHWVGFWVDFGGSWAAFGRVGAGFGEGFGVSWGLLGRFWGSFFQACIWNGC